jgi:hypothetical protein
MITTESTPTLAELAARYSPVRVVAAEMSRTVRMAAFEMSGLTEGCRQLSDAYNRLRVDLSDTLESLHIDATVHPERALEAFDGGGVIAEAITGFDEVYDAVVELQAAVDGLLNALDGAAGLGCFGAGVGCGSVVGVGHGRDEKPVSEALRLLRPAARLETFPPYGLFDDPRQRWPGIVRVEVGFTLR